MPKLFHLWLDTEDEFFTRLDSCGGWPIGQNYVVREHCCDRERPCHFSSTPQHDEWNTTLYSVDDYYWWKVSPAKKKQIYAQYWKKFKRKVISLLWAMF